MIASINGLTHEHLSHTLEYILMSVSVVAVLLIIFFARLRYVKNEHIPAEDLTDSSFISRLIANKYYVDEIYEAIIGKPINYLSSAIHKYVEQGFIDMLINKSGSISVMGGRVLRFVQTGNIGFYLFIMVIGIIAILIFNSFM
jgi:NADH-quinone oxidoreductase subunit L